MVYICKLDLKKTFPRYFLERYRQELFQARRWPFHKRAESAVDPEQEIAVQAIDADIESGEEWPAIPTAPESLHLPAPFSQIVNSYKQASIDISNKQQFPTLTTDSETTPLSNS